MRKFLFLLAILTTFSSFAQDKTSEIRLNAFSVIAFKQLDLTYEYIINEESSVGLDVVIGLSKEPNNAFLKGNQKYVITPYYRYHLPESIANGIFLEAFLAANGGENFIKKDDEDIPDGGSAIDDESDYLAFGYSDFAFGLGGGYKYISYGGFIAEVFGGIGRNLSGEKASPGVLPRVGVSFGFRF